MKDVAAVLLLIAAAACASAPEADGPVAGSETDTPTVLTPVPSDPVLDTPAFAAALEALGDVSRGRYVEGECESAAIADPAYAGFDVRRCAYDEGGLSAIVYVLNAPAHEIARWVAGACEAVRRADDGACATRLVRHMRSSNSFIFPVAGDVLEPASSAGPGCAARHGDATVHVFFRDGVTIETERDYTCETYAISTADAEAEAFKQPATVFNVARIAALHRNDYARLTGVRRPSDDEWRAIVRDSYLEALRTGRYSLLDLVARKLEE
jgi:hypothetical protein